jgi:hypothetical protein
VPPETFHNTISLSGPDLKQAVLNAKKQEEAVYLIFLHTGKPYTASDITRLTEKAGLKYPLWSNRRAITNLKTAGKLVMLEEMKMGPHGKNEHFYKIPA